VTVHRRFARPVLAVIGCALALAACSDSSGTLDQAATERAVGRAVAGEVAPAVSKTTCDEHLTREEGGTFTCTVTLKGVGDLPVTVHQVDSKGTLDAVPAAAVVTKKRITEELTASLKKRFGRTFTVRCRGAGVEVRTPSSTSTCGASDATSKRQVTVTVRDASGTLAFAVAPAK